MLQLAFSVTPFIVCMSALTSCSFGAFGKGVTTQRYLYSHIKTPVLATFFVFGSDFNTLRYKSAQNTCLFWRLPFVFVLGLTLLSYVLALPKFKVDGIENNERQGRQNSSGTEMTSSERILKLIRRKPTISAAEIAKELNMSP